MRQSRSTGKETRLKRQARRYATQLLTGTVLAIDPSSSSRRSDPGYALFEAGRLVDSGILSIPSGKDLHVKLQLIAQTLREQFEIPDILVIEYIPPFMNGRTINKSVVNLHQACGAIKSAISCPRLVEVLPVSWRKYVPKEYEKTDTNDAIMIGAAALLEADDTLSLEQLLPSNILMQVGCKESSNDE